MSFIRLAVLLALPAAFALPAGAWNRSPATSQTVDSQWTAKVTQYTIARILAHLPPARGR